MKGKKESKKKSGTSVQYPHNLGFSAIESINGRVKDGLYEFDREIEWLHELLFECKKAFAKPDIQLLPKTPSAKRRGRQKRPATCSDSEDVFVEPSSKRQSIKPDDGDDADVEDACVISPQPTRTYRTRAASRTVTTTARPKRNTRTNKTVKNEEPILSMTKYAKEEPKRSLQVKNSPQEVKIQEGEVSSVDISTPKAVQIEQPINSDTLEVVDYKYDKDLVVQETPEMCATTPVTPLTVKISNCSDEDTPVKTQQFNHSDVDTPVNKQSVKENSPELEKSKKSRVSIRKSLKQGKTLNSSTRLSSIKRMSLLTLQTIETEARSSMCNQTESLHVLSKAQSPCEKPVRTRTRLRQKTASQNTEGASSVSSVSSQGSVADLDNSTAEEKPPKSTRTKTRQPKSGSAKKTRTKVCNKHQSGQPSSVDLSDDEVMLIDDSDDEHISDDNQRLSANNDCAIADDVKPVRSTRTKQKNNTASSVKVDSENEDSGILSSMSETTLPRTTRSKMRQNKTSAYSSSCSDSEEQFIKPEKPPPRTRTKTKKRALSDDEADMSISKKSCMDQSNISDMSVGLPVSNSTFMSGKQDDAKASSDEECASSSDFDSPVCPKNKVVRPKPNISSFVHNLNNKIAVSNKPGIVKSFIKRNSPARKLTPKQVQEQKKKELLEKERKETERLRRRHIEMQQKIEEQRRKNDEKMKKVTEAREQKAKRDQEMKEKLIKKLEEKRQQNEKQKEEKAKEDQEKQHLRYKKLQETEERRKHEEEERQQKIQLQDDENRMMKEFMTRKKELEEQERQRKIVEEKKRYEERMAALERERQVELEMLKKKEEEKAREQQKIKEERERQMAIEKAEKEKQALEQKKQKDQLLKERMERIKELEKKRLLEEEKRRAELREREEAVKQIINSHNTNLKNTKEEIYKNAMSGAMASLNTTQTKPYNPDSYEMTPAKTYKPSTFESYDISGLKSDDSTDDEDAPKKRLPTWASGPNLKAALVNQHYYPPDLETMFDEIIPPDLNEIFIKKKARFNKRTSSAHWDSPILRPGSVVLNW